MKELPGQRGNEGQTHVGQAFGRREATPPFHDHYSSIAGSKDNSGGPKGPSSMIGLGDEKPLPIVGREVSGHSKPVRILGSEGGVSHDEEVKNSSSDKTEDQPKTLDQDIRSLFDSEAADIIATLGDHSLSVVTGPFGIGKSSILIPEITNLLEQQQRDVIKIDGVLADIPDELPDVFEETPNPTRGVAIIDEAGNFRTEEQKINVLRIANEKGFSTAIPVIAYNIDSDIREREAAAWQQAGEVVYGKPQQEIPVVHLTPKLLPVDLARRFLSSFPNTPPEAIDYVLTNVPLTLIALNRVRGASSVQATQKAILANCDGWPGAIPQSQLKQLKEKVRADLGNASYP